MSRRSLGLGRTVRVAAVFLATALLLELSTRFILPWLSDAVPSYRESRNRLEGVAPGEDALPQRNADYPWWIQENILHPYLGFVRNPDLRDRTFNGEPVDSEVNAYGFFGPSPVGKRAKDKLIVAVTGGSAAAELYLYSRETLARRLEELPRFADKEIVLLSLAVGGMKQPQQLMAFSYLSSLGAEFDLVINLDGFNELVLPLTENVPLGVTINYPRNWPAYATKGFDMAEAVLLGRLADLREARLRRAQGFRTSLLARSGFALAVWDVWDHRHTAEIDALQAALRRAREEDAVEQTAQVRGPDPPERGQSSTLRSIIALWKRSSIQLARLCKANGVEYFHFLQPNQYVPGVKRLTPEELQIAYLEKSKYRQIVELGYPQLSRASRSLPSSGVNFTDLTRMFLNERHTVYRDNCCHLNQRGYDLLAGRIIDAVAGRPNPDT